MGQITLEWLNGDCRWVCFYYQMQRGPLLQLAIKSLLQNTTVLTFHLYGWHGHIPFPQKSIRLFMATAGNTEKPPISCSIWRDKVKISNYAECQDCRRHVRLGRQSLCWVFFTKVFYLCNLQGIFAANPIAQPNRCHIQRVTCHQEFIKK